MKKGDKSELENYRISRAEETLNDVKIRFLLIIRT